LPDVETEFPQVNGRGITIALLFPNGYPFKMAKR